MNRHNLECPSCGKTGEGEWHHPAFDESYYQCKCGNGWHPELLESEPESGEFTKEVREAIISNGRKNSGFYDTQMCLEACDRTDWRDEKSRRICDLETIIEQLQVELKSKDAKIEQLQAEVDACRAEIKRLEGKV